jgi:NAD(P) transhydrogenase
MDLHQKIRAQKLEMGDRDVLVTLSDGSRLVAEKVLVAAGRVGNVETLNLPGAGLKATDKGLLEVNVHYQTSVPHIYAAGDLVGFPMLASVSMEQGRVAMSHACGLTRKKLTDVLPVGIYTIPEVSAVGESEEALRAKGRPYVVGRASLTGNARANLIGEAVGFLKLLADPKDGKLLGIHCIGPHASELVHLGQAVMSLGGDLSYFVEAVFNYPTLGEAYKYAAYDALDNMRAMKVTPIDRAAAK